jgi:catechol 2,3-dioxygenase-like lactoylglutathione lyase family enzyme
MSFFDHVAIKSEDVARDVARYRELGFKVEACYEDWGMVRDERGVGIALLGPGSHHPTHFAIRVADLDELKRAAEAEGRPLQHHRDRTISFYTKGAQGVALEFIWYPEAESKA